MLEKIIRLVCFCLVGVIMSLSGFGFTSWQYWSLLIVIGMIYCCGIFRGEKKSSST